MCGKQQEIFSVHWHRKLDHLYSYISDRYQSSTLLLFFFEKLSHFFFFQAKSLPHFCCLINQGKGFPIQTFFRFISIFFSLFSPLHNLFSQVVAEMQRRELPPVFYAVSIQTLVEKEEGRTNFFPKKISIFHFFFFRGACYLRQTFWMFIKNSQEKLVSSSFWVSTQLSS